MLESGIRARHKRRFKATTDSKHSMPVADNLLNRQCTPDAPNSLWAGDITYIPTADGWLYVAGGGWICSTARSWARRSRRA